MPIDVDSLATQNAAHTHIKIKAREKRNTSQETRKKKQTSKLQCSLSQIKFYHWLDAYRTYRLTKRLTLWWRIFCCCCALNWSRRRRYQKSRQYYSYNNLIGCQRTNIMLHGIIFVFIKRFYFSMFNSFVWIAVDNLQ